MSTSRTPTTRRIAQQTASTDEQRQRLVLSAYNLIAEKGMASLRIRKEKRKKVRHSKISGNCLI